MNPKFVNCIKLYISILGQSYLQNVIECRPLKLLLKNAKKISISSQSFNVNLI